MIKRIISALLCFTIISASLAVFADEEAVANPQYDKRVEMLSALGITFVEGVEYNDDVKRAEFIKTVLDFAGVKNFSEGRKFYDVDETNQYYKAINKGAELGYMIGDDEENFHPERGISVNEAAKVLVTVLGYEIIAKANGDWPQGYMMTAQKIDLLDGVETSIEPLNYENFSRLLENALECEVFELQIDGSGLSYGSTEDIDALWKFHSIRKVEGVVTANSITGLESKEGAAAGNKYVELNGEAVLAGESNAGNFLGYKVDAYLNYEDEDEPEIRYITPNKKNKVLVLEPEDICGDNGKFTTDNFVYTVGGRQKSIAINDKTNIIYNGVAKPDYKKDDLIPQIGNVTLIDADGNGKFETISVFKAVAETIMIVGNSIKNDDGITIEDKNNSLKKYVYDAEYENYAVYINGKLSNPSEIQKDMIVTIGKNEQHSITYAYSNNTIRGSVSTFSDGGLKDLDRVTINEVEYVIAPGAEVYSIKLGTTGKFYTDGKNNIFGVKKDVDINIQYGYMIGGFYDEYEEGGGSFLKVLNTEGDIVKIFFAEKVKFNDSQSTIEKVMPELKDGGAWKRQVIMYETDEEGIISKLYTAKDNSDGRNDSAVLRYEGKFVDEGNYSGYGFSQDTWKNRFYQDKETIYFNINTASLEDSYVSGPLTTIARNDYTHYFYNVDPELMTVDVVVWERQTSQEAVNVANNIRPGLVVSNVDILNEDDEVVRALGVYKDGKVTYMEAYDKLSPDAKWEFDNAQPGDVVFYEVDGVGRITNICRGFDSTRSDEYGFAGMGKPRNALVHGKKGVQPHLERGTAYWQVVKKLPNNFFEYVSCGTAEECGSIQRMNPNSPVYRVIKTRNGYVTVEQMTYEDVQDGDNIFVYMITNTIYTMYVMEIDE